MFLNSHIVNSSRVTGEIQRIPKDPVLYIRPSNNGHNIIEGVSENFTQCSQDFIWEYEGRKIVFDYSLKLLEKNTDNLSINIKPASHFLSTVDVDILGVC